MKSNTTILSTLVVIILIMFCSSASAVNSFKANERSPIIEADGMSKSQIRNAAKFERKKNKLNKKLKRIEGKGEQMSKRGILVILGVVLLLLGIIVIASIPSSGTIIGLFEALFRVIFGIGLGIGGLVTMMIGLVIKDRNKQE